jgi:phospholipase/lecithinase/hemolysin
LYVIEMGGNDIRDALAAAASGGDPSAVLQQALTSIAGQIGVLYQAGARRFLVWNAPNVGLTPAIRQLDLQFPGIAPLATLLTIAFNGGLNVVVQQLSALPGIEIRRFDAFQKLNEMTSSPAAFGLTNVTSACITLETPYVCEEPDQYLFWDGIHPTRAVHAILALEAASVLSQ